MNQERLNFAWQGNFARNWPQALTVLRPVKRSRSTYYDGPRLSSFMLWVWCGSSHKTPGCTLVCITLVLGSWQGSFVVGCVRSTTCSEVPVTWVLRRCGVGGPAILRVSIWRRFRAETLHPLQSFDISPLIGSWISSSIGRFFFLVCFEKGHYPLNMQHLFYIYLLSFTGEKFHILFHYFTNVLSTSDWHVKYLLMSTKIVIDSASMRL